MKKLMLSILVLAGLSANAHIVQEGDYRDAREQREAAASQVQICPQYNATAIQSIYKYLTANAAQIQINVNVARAEKETCKRIANYSDLSVQEMQAYAARCENVDQKLALAAAVYTAALEASKVTAAQYESRLTTNSVMSCEVNVQKVNGLKQLLNL